MTIRSNPLNLLKSLLHDCSISYSYLRENQTNRRACFLVAQLAGSLAATSFFRWLLHFLKPETSAIFGPATALLEREIVAVTDAEEKYV